MTLCDIEISKPFEEPIYHVNNQLLPSSTFVFIFNEQLLIVNEQYLIVNEHVPIVNKKLSIVNVHISIVNEALPNNNNNNNVNVAMVVAGRDQGRLSP